MNFKLITCGLFGHEFNERFMQKEKYNGVEFIVRIERKCSRCQMSDVDTSSSTVLYKLKYEKQPDVVIR